ncbi:MAG TPA: thrombospondin type 3 repeat-containing protein, partial [Phycisphaerae bacterium]|nr:thrombospondin type 3 repeat-containing protein [Phycisphaerae bacterium]
TAPAMLNTNAATDSGDDDAPQVTTDGHGHWVTAWFSFDTLSGTIGGDSDILMARFVLPDCNSNGLPDSEDIAGGTSTDCNGNGIPDECEADRDNDGTIDSCDACPDDPARIVPGACGCGLADVDTDGDGVLDCNDGCSNDPLKTIPGVCGCGIADVDDDGDGVADCIDNCPNTPNADQTDSNADGIGDACEAPPAVQPASACGVCGVAGVPLAPVTLLGFAWMKCWQRKSRGRWE